MFKYVTLLAFQEYLLTPLKILLNIFVLIKK